MDIEFFENKRLIETKIICSFARSDIYQGIITIQETDAAMDTTVITKCQKLNVGHKRRD